MITKEKLYCDLDKLGIDKKGTVLIHSSYKSIGDVDGRGETVLDVWMDYMKDGLLVFPTHSWSYINSKNPVFDVNESPSCIGILPELFRKREGVVRSYHPTHSVAAVGTHAKDYVSGHECFDTPCARTSPWGKLYDRDAIIVLMGVDLRRNTYIHGVEEWVDVPNRLTDEKEELYVVKEDGSKIVVPSRRHTPGHWSEYFYKVDNYLVEQGVMRTGYFGESLVRIIKAKELAHCLTQLLKKNPDLFSNHDPFDIKSYL